jgi:drug/metabolite transporter (DMT)-like permease
MRDPQPPRRTLRSIGALLAGFVLVVVLSIGTDSALHATGVLPPWGQPMSDVLFLLATAYRTLYAVAGSYVTARFAPHRPMKHALAGGLVGLVLSIVGAVTMWDRGPDFGPHWYPLALVASAMPCAWAGGRLNAWRRFGRPER